MVRSIIIRVVASIVTFVLFCILINNGCAAFFLIGAIVAILLSLKQFKIHIDSGYMSWMYSLVFIWDMLLWQSAIYVSIREAYACRDIN